MNMYIPEYLGKIISTDSEKLTNFCTNQYDAFCIVYNACKNFSTNITDIKPVEIDNKSFSVKISTDTDTLQSIAMNTNIPSVTLNNDIISVAL